MRCFASLVVCATLLQVLCFSQSSGQDNDIDCTEAELDKSECCSSQNSCVFINCTSNDKSVAACYNDTEGASCDDDAEAVNSCGTDVTTPDKSDKEITEAPTTDETVDCNTHTLSGDKEACCAAGNSTACIFFTCATDNGTETGAECVAADAERTCKDEDSTPGENTCKEEETPEDKEEETPEVDCAAHSSEKNDCCTAGNSTACIFFNCSNADGDVTDALCAAFNSTPECPEKKDTLSDNLCEEPGLPVTTRPEDQNATQSPTAGEDTGGQQFDAASFIGGIVLCAGILAIAFFGLKFYRSRQERNYESM